MSIGARRSVRWGRVLAGLAALLLVAAIGGGLVLRGKAAGPVLRTVTLPGSPWAAALDDQTGHLLLVNRSYGFGIQQSLGAYPGRGGSYANGGTVTMLTMRGNSSAGTIGVGADPRAVAVDAQQGLAYVTNDDEASMSVLDTRSGALLHTTQVGSRPHALVVDAPANHLFVVNTSDRTVSMLDARRNTVLHVVHVPAAVDYSGAAVDTRTARVFIVGGGAISTLDARSGALLGTTTLERDSFQRPGLEIAQMVVDERAGHIYALGTNFLTVLDAKSGRVLREIPVDIRASALAVDSRNGHLLVANTGAVDATGNITGAGSLQVLDPTSGVVLRTISLGVAPNAVIVDAHANHVLVVDGGGQHRVANPWSWLPDGIRKLIPFLSAPGTTNTVSGSVLVLDLSQL